MRIGRGVRKAIPFELHGVPRLRRPRIFSAPKRDQAKPIFRVGFEDGVEAPSVVLTARFAIARHTAIIDSPAQGFEILLLLVPKREETELVVHSNAKIMAREIVGAGWNLAWMVLVELVVLAFLAGGENFLGLGQTLASAFLTGLQNFPALFIKIPRLELLLTTYELHDGSLPSPAT